MDVLDINNDGYDDLVVGAPQYFKSRDGFEVGGAVFAFISGEDSPLGSGFKICLLENYCGKIFDFSDLTPRRL